MPFSSAKRRQAWKRSWTLGPVNECPTTSNADSKLTDALRELTSIADGPSSTTPPRSNVRLPSSSSSGGFHSNLLGVESRQHARRESFLYKLEEPSLFVTDHKTRPASRCSSVTSQDPIIHGDEIIVTPFAQLLSSLRNVRSNLISIANLPNDEEKYRIPKRPPLHNTPLPEPAQQCAQETLEELDWCLDQLEAIQLHRSVSEMASSKFRKLLNKELSQFAESSKSGTQVTKFLINTYMDREEEQDDNVNRSGTDKDETFAPTSGSSAHDSPTVTTPIAALPHAPIGSPQLSLFNKAKTAAMSRISGVRRLRAQTHGGTPPEFGVECSKEIAVYMNRINDWGLNVFKIHELSKQHALTVVTYTILRERDLLKRFEIAPSILVTYLLNLEHHYKENPYHNQIHGADVAQSINVLISSPALEGVFTEMETLAAVFAAAIHDVDHPGYTNQYLINSNSELAIMYNDESVLEQHHLAVAFKLLQDPSCDFLYAWSKKQRQAFRKIVIGMVLATDMSKHMSLLADLKTMVEAKKVSGSSVVQLDKYNDRSQVLQSMIHLADLSNPTKPIELYRCWNERILEEYWRQGDKEKEQGLEVSPMCDRGNVTIEKSQVGFIDYIVHPLFETWAELVYPDAQEILDQLEDNRLWYLERIPKEDERTNAHEASGPHPVTITTMKSTSSVDSPRISRQLAPIPSPDPSIGDEEEEK
ncbi:Phosphodiesterase [Aphelenchoides besseyi]|nr:Phosphodiesterase [Aphelenchoides besseyi]